MFGHKQQPLPQTETLVKQPDTAPVHVFDQTNGMLKHFEEQATPQQPGRDNEDTNKVVVSAVVGSAMIGGGPLGQ